MVQATKEQVLLAHDYVPADPLEQLRRLVELLLVQNSDAQPRNQRRNGDLLEEALLTVSIEGIHYTLVRSKPQHTTERVSLSPRELVIAQLIAKGLPNKCISDMLEISPWTVATHLRRIFSKLNVTSRAAMVARLLEESLI